MINIKVIRAFKAFFIVIEDYSALSGVAKISHIPFSPETVTQQVGINDLAG